MPFVHSVNRLPSAALGIAHGHFDDTHTTYVAVNRVNVLSFYRLDSDGTELTHVHDFHLHGTLKYLCAVPICHPDTGALLCHVLFLFTAKQEASLVRLAQSTSSTGHMKLVTLYHSEVEDCLYQVHPGEVSLVCCTPAPHPPCATRPTPIVAPFVAFAIGYGELYFFDVLAALAQALRRESRHGRRGSLARWLGPVVTAWAEERRGQRCFSHTALHSSEYDVRSIAFGFSSASATLCTTAAAGATRINTDAPPVCAPVSPGRVMEHVPLSVTHTPPTVVTHSTTGSHSRARRVEREDDDGASHITPRRHRRSRRTHHPHPHRRRPSPCHGPSSDAEMDEVDSLRRWAYRHDIGSRSRSSRSSSDDKNSSDGSDHRRTFRGSYQMDAGNHATTNHPHSHNHNHHSQHTRCKERTMAGAEQHEEDDKEAAICPLGGEIALRAKAVATVVPLYILYADRHGRAHVSEYDFDTSAVSRGTATMMIMNETGLEPASSSTVGGRIGGCPIALSHGTRWWESEAQRMTRRALCQSNLEATASKLMVSEWGIFVMGNQLITLIQPPSLWPGPTHLSSSSTGGVGGGGHTAAHSAPRRRRKHVLTRELPRGCAAGELSCVCLMAPHTLLLCWMSGLLVRVVVCGSDSSVSDVHVHANVNVNVNEGPVHNEADTDDGVVSTHHHRLGASGESHADEEHSDSLLVGVHPYNRARPADAANDIMAPTGVWAEWEAPTRPAHTASSSSTMTTALCAVSPACELVITAISPPLPTLPTAIIALIPRRLAIASQFAHSLLYDVPSREAQVWIDHCGPVMDMTVMGDGPQTRVLASTGVGPHGGLSLVLSAVKVSERAVVSLDHADCTKNSHNDSQSITVNGRNNNHHHKGSGYVPSASSHRVIGMSFADPLLIVSCHGCTRYFVMNLTGTGMSEVRLVTAAAAASSSSCAAAWRVHAKMGTNNTYSDSIHEASMTERMGEEHENDPNRTDVADSPSPGEWCDRLRREVVMALYADQPAQRHVIVTASGFYVWARVVLATRGQPIDEEENDHDHEEEEGAVEVQTGAPIPVPSPLSTRSLLFAALTAQVGLFCDGAARIVGRPASDYRACTSSQLGCVRASDTREARVHEVGTCTNLFESITADNRNSANKGEGGHCDCTCRYRCSDGVVLTRGFVWRTEAAVSALTAVSATMFAYGDWAGSVALCQVGDELAGGCVCVGRLRVSSLARSLCTLHVVEGDESKEEELRDAAASCYSHLMDETDIVPTHGGGGGIRTDIKNMNSTENDDNEANNARRLSCGKHVGGLCTHGADTLCLGDHHASSAARVTPARRTAHLFIGTMDGFIVEASLASMRAGRVLRRLFLTSAPVELSVLRRGEALLCCGDVPLVVIRRPDTLQVTGLTRQAVSACVALHRTASANRYNHTKEAYKESSGSAVAMKNTPVAYDTEDHVLFVTHHPSPTLSLGRIGEVQKMNRTFLPLYGTVTHMTDTPAWGGVVVSVRRPGRDGLVFVPYHVMKSSSEADRSRGVRAGVVGGGGGGAEADGRAKEDEPVECDSSPALPADSTTPTAAAAVEARWSELSLLDNERCVCVEWVGLGAQHDGDPRLCLGMTTTTATAHSSPGTSSGGGASMTPAEAVVLVGSSFIFADESLARSSRLTWYTLRPQSREEGHVGSLGLSTAAPPGHRASSPSSASSSARTCAPAHTTTTTTTPAAHTPSSLGQRRRVLVEISGQDIAGALQCCAVVPHDRGRIALGISGCVVLYRWTPSDACFVAEERCRIGLGMVKLLPVFSRPGEPALSRLIALDARHSAFFLCVDRVQDRITVQGRESALRGVMDGLALGAQSVVMCDDAMNVYCMRNEARVPVLTSDNPVLAAAAPAARLPDTRTSGYAASSLDTRVQHNPNPNNNNNNSVAGLPPAPPVWSASAPPLSSSAAAAAAAVPPTSYRLRVEAQIHLGDLVTCMQPGSFALFPHTTAHPHPRHMSAAPSFGCGTCDHTARAGKGTDHNNTNHSKEEEEEDEEEFGRSEAVSASPPHTHTGSSESCPPWLQPCASREDEANTAVGQEDDDDAVNEETTTHRAVGSVALSRRGAVQIVFGTAHGGFGTLTAVTPLAFVVMQSVARAVREAAAGERAAGGGFDADAFHAPMRVGQPRGLNGRIGLDAAMVGGGSGEAAGGVGRRNSVPSEEGLSAAMTWSSSRCRGVCEGAAWEAFVSLRRGARPHVCLRASVYAANTWAAARPEWSRFQAGVWVPECAGGSMQSLTQLQGVVEWVNGRLTQERLPTLPFRPESVEALVIAFQRVY